MKVTTFLTAIVLAAAPSLVAQDGAALFKSKCVACHGANGAGKASMKGTNLLSDDAKKETDVQLNDMILNGGAAKKASHSFEKKGVTADQATALVAYIRTLQK